MSHALHNRSIIVTGAARGIGEAIARGLAQQQAQVVVADINAQQARAVAESITAAGGQAIAVAVDVSQRASVRAMVAAAVAAYGKLDVIFNNAGVAQARPFLAITEQDWHSVMNVNALGCLIAMQEAIAQMLAQKTPGKVINTASIAGKQGHDPLAHYSASKFAVRALTHAAARAFGPHGITVNAICPGVVDTPMWGAIDEGIGAQERAPGETFRQAAAAAVLGRASVPQDLVGVSVFLAGPGSDFMTGQSLVVDGGMVFD